MKGRLSQPQSPVLTPFHERGDGKEETKQYSGECEPCPEISEFCGEGKREVPHHEGEASREVKENAGLGCLGLVAVRYICIQGCRTHLEAEHTWKEIDISWALNGSDMRGKQRLGGHTNTQSHER